MEFALVLLLGLVAGTVGGIVGFDLLLLADAVERHLPLARVAR